MVASTVIVARAEHTSKGTKYSQPVINNKDGYNEIVFRKVDSHQEQSREKIYKFYDDYQRVQKQPWHEKCGIVLKNTYL